MEGAGRDPQLEAVTYPCAAVSTPEYMLRPDPDRLRELADWLADEHQHELSSAAHRAASEFDVEPDTALDGGGFSEGPRRDG